MIRRILIAFMLLVSSSNVFALTDTPLSPPTPPNEGSEIELNKTTENNQKTHRKPAFIPVHAYFTPETRMISIDCPDYYEGEAMIIYNDVIIDFSNEINTTFILPSTPGKYYLKITTESWEATGVVEI